MTRDWAAVEQRAAAWVVDIHPHARHLVRTRDWLVELAPDASPELRVAAVLHDIERAFPDPDLDGDPADLWDDPAHLEYHQTRSARFAAEWLSGAGIDDESIACVVALIEVHELGGWPEADLLQAADSLSFLETLGELTLDWVRRGADPSRAEGKLRFMAERIRVPAARRLAAPMLDGVLERLAALPISR